MKVGIGIAAGDGRHHRSIDDAQRADAVYAQLRVGDGTRVAAHAAGTDRVIRRCCLGADVAGPVGIARRQWMGPAVGDHQLFERRRAEQPGDQFLAADHGLKVPFVTKKLMNDAWLRSEEHTSELQSLMRISYAVFCLKKKK